MSRNQQLAESAAGERSGPWRILHTLAPGPYGGLEQVVKNLASEQVRVGHAVTVAAVLGKSESENPFPQALRDLGAKVHELRLRPRAYFRERSLIGALCDQVLPGVVHTHGYRADVLHGAVARARGVPVVATVHGFTGGDRKNRFYEWLQRRAYRRYDAVVAVSQLLAAELEADQLAPGRVHCIPNAWVHETEFFGRSEAREHLGLEQEAEWVGFVGRLSREKGADLFVDAIADLRVARGVMIGDGRLRDQLEQRARVPETSRRIRFTGVVRGASKYMKALDVFVLSSRTEGTPIALLEAIAAGVPVVATRVGGVPDVVSEQEAVLVEPGRPGDLAAAIARVLADPEAARSRADRARQRILDHFGPEHWVERYDDVYRAARAARGS